VEEAVPLRERDTSPPRQRSSPTRMASAYSQDQQALLRQHSRDGGERPGPVNGRPLALSRRGTAEL
jgi:hypothetical protein